MITGRPRASPCSGQGTAEYALLISLVAIVVILGVSLLGEGIREQFCDIVTTLDPDADVSAICSADDDATPPADATPPPDDLQVSCNGIGDGSTVSSPVTLEAVVTDNVGPDNVSTVKFTVKAPTSSSNTEGAYRYCLKGGDASCEALALAPGSYTITANATDADGNTGSCSVSFTVN